MPEPRIMVRRPLCVERYKTSRVAKRVKILSRKRAHLEVFTPRLQEERRITRPADLPVELQESEERR